MTTIQRRIEILRILSRCRQTKIVSLAQELGVCDKTIRRDIDFLSTDYPIYTLRGKYGGVFVTDNFRLDRMYMNEEKIALLKKLSSKIENGDVLTKSEKETFDAIIAEYSAPSGKKERENESK
ncbi:MAG: DeoR family transcriptional regulator [Clostridia bacterium]|nr:DeoR family transcriptional regulator [Clostridia bacterium]